MREGGRWRRAALLQRERAHTAAGEASDKPDARQQNIQAEEAEATAAIETDDEAAKKSTADKKAAAKATATANAEPKAKAHPGEERRATAEGQRRCNEDQAAPPELTADQAIAGGSYGMLAAASFIGVGDSRPRIVPQIRRAS